MATGFVWHETYMWHDTGSGVAFLEPGGFLQPDEHVESPESKRRFRNLLEVSGLLEELVAVAPRPASRLELERVHSPDHVERVAALSAEHGGLAGDEAPFGPGGFEIAALAAGGVLAAVEAVLAGEIDNAYALVRPPGHHAMADQGFGFCIFNNGAVAAAHLIESLGAERVAIVDWDAHHGNGAQGIFWDDPRVLTISIHQDGAFPPGSGSWDETGGPEIREALEQLDAAYHREGRCLHFLPTDLVLAAYHRPQLAFVPAVRGSHCKEQSHQGSGPRHRRIRRIGRSPCIGNTAIPRKYHPCGTPSHSPPSCPASQNPAAVATYQAPSHRPPRFGGASRSTNDGPSAPTRSSPTDSSPRQPSSQPILTGEPSCPSRAATTNGT